MTPALAWTGDRESKFFVDWPISIAGSVVVTSIMTGVVALLGRRQR